MLITNAPERADDEYDKRRRRYVMMMGLRIVCVIGAVATYHLSVLLALAFVIAGAALPWCAVLIANDRPPKKRPAKPATPVTGREQALPAGDDDRTVDG